MDNLATRPAALNTRELSVRFGGLVALDSVSISVEQGRIVSIVGPNGAGKSTLLNSVNRLYRTTGQVFIFGRNVSVAQPYEFSKLQVGRTFQDPQLMDNETALENILGGAHSTLGYSPLDQVIGRRRVAESERKAIANAMELLDLVGLSDVAWQRCSQLSYGARKLIDILRSMLSEPKLILLDEPTSGLDTAERRKVEKLLLHLNETSGIAMLVVEHHMDIVKAISDRVIALQSGTVSLDGDVDEVLGSQEFRKAMIGGH